MNKAQNLLKVQFPHINGLQLSLLQVKELRTTTAGVIDLMYKSLDEETKATINRLFQSGSTPPVIKVVSPQRQIGNKDCGLFAIAFATANAFGQYPVKKSFQFTHALVSRHYSRIRYLCT